MKDVDFDTKVKKEDKDKLVSIKPLKDFEVKHNEFHYKIKKGEKIKVHKMFLKNLVTEKVIEKSE